MMEYWNTRMMDPPLGAWRPFIARYACNHTGLDHACAPLAHVTRAQ